MSIHLQAVGICISQRAPSDVRVRVDASIQASKVRLDTCPQQRVVVLNANVREDLAPQCIYQLRHHF
jgi:hypothetical protein